MRSRLFPINAVYLCLLFLLAGTSLVRAVSGANQISAANIIVVQNDLSNNAASVTLSMPVSINDFRVINAPPTSRADYFVQIGADATDDVTNGILISCIDQNGRDNGETDFYGVNFGTSAIDSTGGQWWIPVFQAPQNAEYNFNVAAAYFPYAEGWLGGWLYNSSGVNGGANNRLIGNPNLQLGTHVVDLGGGKTTVDLRAFGMDSRSNAVLLAVAGKNEANFALAGGNTNGTWTVYVHDDNGGGEQDYVGFVCVPLTNHTLVSGKFRGNAAIALKSETFTVTSIGVGTYHLSIPGVNPTNGVLIVSAEGGDTNNVDNIVSYQLNGDGWDIQTRDINAGYAPALQQLPNGEDVVSFVFIPAPAPRSLTWLGAPQTIWSTNGGNVWRSGTNLALAYADGNAVMFDDSASNFTATVSGTVSPASIMVANTAHTYTLNGSGKISGATGLTKQGTGTLVLSTVNDYSGDTAIYQGAVLLGTGGAIPSGANAGNVILNGSLNLSGFSSTLNNLSGSGVLNDTSGAATLTLNMTTISTYSGMLGVSGSPALVVTGGGSLTLNGTAVVTEANISNATLKVNGTLTANHVTVQNGSTLGGTGTVNSPVICENGSSLALSPANSLAVGSLALNGAVNVTVVGNISLTNSGQYVLLQHGAESGGGFFNLIQPPGLQCNGFKALLVDSGGQLKLVVTNAPLNGTLGDVRHVVLLMNENRSYDHYFGTLHGGRGFNDRNAMLLTNGLNAFYQPTRSTPAYELPFHSSEQCLKDLNHTWPVTHTTFNFGRSDQWVPNKTAETMMYYTRDDLPFYYELVDAYTVCDEYHASVISSTFPNRFMYMTGTIDPHSTGGGPEIDNSTPPNGFRWKTYPEMLQDAGVTWNIYQVSSSDGDNITKQFANFKNAQPGNPLYDRGMVMASDVNAMVALFKRDVTNNTLPSVSWIIGPGAYSEHPPNSPANGEILTKAILDAIAANPAVYNSTVYIVNYDENDGFFDHAMPILPPQGTPDEFVGNMPIGLGVRVPCILASPWTRGGRVCSEVFDHTSTIRFLEQWTGVQCPNISAWRRQVCGDMTSAFDFAHPDFTYPGASFTDLSLINCPSGITVSPPTTQTVPTQEPGTLTAVAVPYQPNAFCTLNSSASTITIAMTNSGAASVHFGVYPNTYSYSTDTPQQFDVANATSATTSFSLSTTAGKYDFSCYGPDGFQRRFAGNLSSDYNRIEVASTLDPTDASCAIALQNLSTLPVTFTVTNGYTSQTASYVVPARSTNVISIGSETNNGLYDVKVTASADALFLRRFLGRAQIAPVTVVPPPTVLFNPTVVSGKFRFNFTGPSGQSYKVLVTTNAADSSSWQVASYGIFGNSAGTFTETNAVTNQQTRYYQVTTP